MSKKLREKFGKSHKLKVRKIKVRYLMLVMVLAGMMIPKVPAQAESCPDVRIVFARGSGGEHYNTNDYLEFKNTIENKLATIDLSYEFIDLDYPAVGVGLDNLDVTIGAFFGSGDAYEFGESVDTGVKNLTRIINNDSCKNTKYVLGGYSQGAMVVSKSLGSLNADKIIYAATFGDPKIYLPEGRGIMPAACRGENLSDYRMYVPDCQAYKGLLGAYEPYEPESLIGKVGTWCNKKDIFCSSHISVSDHVAYASDALYEDASRVIFDKITKQFGIENHISSPHDTAILIDSTGSMHSMINKYKEEAFRLAKETLDAGGRVALYDYRDLSDPYTPVEHCNFETCTLEIFQSELDEINVDGGGDTPESLLSASFYVMGSLNWKYGSTKSLVVLTDANFLSPDRDGMTFDEVVRLSKVIDPVNFYIITNNKYGDSYAELAEQTGGMVVTNLNELNLLTDYIIERYDSLPRVEESDSVDLPYLEIEKIERISNTDVRVKFNTDGTKTLVLLNGVLLGVTDEKEITISGLNSELENDLMLAPLNETHHGDGVNLNLDSYGYIEVSNGVVSMPKAPNTGKLN